MNLRCLPLIHPHKNTQTFSCIETTVGNDVITTVGNDVITTLLARHTVTSMRWCGINGRYSGKVSLCIFNHYLFEKLVKEIHIVSLKTLLLIQMTGWGHRWHAIYKKKEKLALSTSVTFKCYCMEDWICFLCKYNIFVCVFICLGILFDLISIFFAFIYSFFCLFYLFIWSFMKTDFTLIYFFN